MFQGFPNNYNGMPQFQNPYQARLDSLQATQGPQMPQDGMNLMGRQLTRANGIAGAQAVPVSPGETIPIFDINQDVFYIKSADNRGYPSIRTFSFTEMFPTQQPSGDFVSRAEFDELKGMIANVQQLIQQPAEPQKPARRSKPAGPADSAE